MILCVTLGLGPKSYLAKLCNKLQLGQVNIDKIIIPTRYDIMRNSRFRKPSLDHSSTSETYFGYTIIHILQTGILSQSDLTLLGLLFNQENDDRFILD